MNQAEIFPYYEPAIAVVNHIIEPALLDLAERMYSPLGRAGLEKLSVILSLQISRIYKSSGLEISTSDPGAILQAHNAVEIAWQYLEDIRNAIIWYCFTETPDLSFFASRLTFSQFMDAYFSVLGHKLGEGEFAGMPTPPVELIEIIFRLLMHKNVERGGPPMLSDPQMLQQWLSYNLAHSVRRYFTECENLKEDRNQLALDIEVCLSQINSGIPQDPLVMALRKSDVAYLQLELDALPATPTPFCARYGWFDEMDDWFNFTWLSTPQLEKLRYDLEMIGYFNPGIDREFRRRKETTNMKKM